jgi:hypothetical protein
VSDADLIYNAFLRAERRYEAAAAREPNVATRAFLMLSHGVVKNIREEIGNGLMGGRA